MIFGYYSPLPPAPTGVADYSAALLPYLQEAVAQTSRAANRSANAPPITIQTNPATCDLALYNIGNNALHRDIYQRAIAEPGIALIHDGVLHHFFLGLAESEADPALYLEEFVYNYGEWTRGLATQLWTGRARSATDPRYFSRPLLKRIATRSRAVIVHNPEAADLVRQHAPDTPVHQIPHLFVPPQLPSDAETERFRQSLGLEPNTLLIATFGHQRETKRLAPLLRAFHRAPEAQPVDTAALHRPDGSQHSASHNSTGNSGPDLRLLVSGDFVSQNYERSLAHLLDHPAILRTGYLPETELWRYAAAAQVCVNLRYPSAAESSGIATRMMGIGKTVICTASKALDNIPANACLRVDPGPAEEEMLTGYLAWLAREPQAVRAIGAAAQSHIAQHHAPETVARQFATVIQTVVQEVIRSTTAHNDPRR